MSDTTQLRIATFNGAMNRSSEGKLLQDLQNGTQQQIKNVAEIIQRTNPDILLVNEFDYDYTVSDPLQLPQLFLENYLNVVQTENIEPIDFPYIYLAPSNTGIPSGFDLDNNGTIGGGNDAFGFGNFPGQYAMVLFSKYPIVTEDVRTFQYFLWKDMPNAQLPDDPNTPEPNDWFSEEELEVVRLSSKSHWDVPINVNGEIIHVLASHPTPPVFDGEEDRNGKRNSDEIRFWADYVNPAKGDYIYDDNGNSGGLGLGKAFVIMGDQNADPYDGDSTPPAIMQLLDNVYIQGSVDSAPSSEGGVDATNRQGLANLTHEGNPAFDTGDFNDNSPGNLRIDYVLPSQNIKIKDSGVFWASPNSPLTGDIFDRLIGDFNPNLPTDQFPERFLSSDHRLVYLDVTFKESNLNLSQNRIQVTDVESLGLVTFPTGYLFNETQVGGLSGITYDSENNLYYSISDDRSQINPARFYTLEIDLTDGSLDEGDVNFTDVTTLLDNNGNPFPALSVDTEGIALTANNTLYITSEGSASSTLINPFVKQFGLDGAEIDGLTIPDKFLPSTENTGIRNNLAFESNTITPDGRFLYTAVEQALKQDGTGTTVDDNSYSRILKYDLTTGEVVAEFVYEVEAIPNPPIPETGFADNGLVELIALDNNGTLLALERSFAVGVGNTVKLYQVQTQGALDVKDFDSLLLDEDTRYDIDPFVSKELLIDFTADLGIIPDNLEGMALGEILPDGRQSLIVVSDNNFNSVQTTQFITLALELETIPAVLPIVETPYTIDQESGDAELFGDSDDPAIWIDPDNADDSLVITTLKDGGLAVFSLTGETLQTITPADVLGEGAEFGDIRYNNVDLIYNFPIQTMIAGVNATVDLAIASDRENDTLAIFGIDPETRQLYKFATPELDEAEFSIFGVDDGEATAYGLANYRSPVDGSYYVFVTQASGNQIAQLKLTTSSPADAPLIFAEVVRVIELPVEEGKEAEDYQSEAITVDQEQGIVYLAVEGELGIVKFDAEPTGSNDITIVRPIDSPELIPDLEGLAIYYAGDGKGYLIASSQGDSSYAVYTRDGNNDYLGSFIIGDNHSLNIDQANETDGLEVINVPLGSNFSFGGLFVQDGANNPQNTVINEDELENNATNFKFVRWEDVANAFTTPLIIDTESYNPRQENIVLEFTFKENFDTFRGAGFTPNPSEGQLDSDIWAIKGLSDGNLDFGGSGITGDFARGVSTGGVSSGGVYAFNLGNEDYIFGVQPAGSDFTPGEILLKLQNTGDETVNEVTISYDISYLNDQDRGNSFNLAYSLDGVTFTPVTELDFTTPELRDSNGWQSVDKITTISGLNLNPDDFFYFQWFSDDVSGGGSRDEFGLNNVGVTNLTAPDDDMPPAPIEAKIYEIQGDGYESPLVEPIVITEGIVTGDFQDGDADNTRNLRGFYIQDAEGDNNPNTSDGLFVFESSLIVDVNVGDLVRVTGNVVEFFGETQIQVTDVQIINNGNSITPTEVTLPSPNTIANANGVLIADLEQYEGMLISFPDTLTVTEMFNLDRFGEMQLSQGGRLEQFTNNNAPDTTGFQAHLEDIASRRIMLDDGLTIQNPNPIIYPAPELSRDNFIRMGDTVSNLTGNVRFSRGSGGSGDEYYRIMPTETPEFNQVTQRPETPEVEGDLKVVSFNVLNFFTTLDNSMSGGSGPNNLQPRGANNQAEFDRQLEKLITTLTDVDGDIIGLIEIENNGFATVASGVSTTGKSAIATIVDELNAVVGEGTYAYVNPGTEFVGSDAIKVSFIYKTTTVDIAPDTVVATLTDADLADLGLDNLAPIFEGEGTSRVPIATTFMEQESGEKLTVVINHFKSKGSSGLQDTSDPNFDQLDGQGFWNQRRIDAATAIDTWLKTDPTNSNDEDFLIIGDLNAYMQEDPIKYLENAGYENLLSSIDNPYSFTFDGQIGALDHALASGSLADQVTGVAEWHINSDEADAFDYNLDFGRNPDLFDGTIPYRVSDHDPVVIGLNLESEIIEPELPETVFGSPNDDNFDSAFMDEKMFAGDAQNLFTGSGDDTVDVSVMGEGNRTDTGSGDDLVFVGTNNRVILGSGNDILFAGAGNGNNMITTGSGYDEIWLITDIEAIPEMMNKVSDFDPNFDVIGFANSGLTMADKGNLWDYQPVGNNVIISAFGQDIAQLNNTTITDANFILA